MLRTHSACFNCTSWTHQTKDCKCDKYKCRTKDDGKECGGEHHHLLHGTSQVLSTHFVLENPRTHIVQAHEARQAHDAVKLCGWDAKARPGEAVNTLLQYQDVDVHGSAEKARTMWDTGSNSVLITHNFARIFRLNPEKIVYYLQSVDHAKERREGNFY